MAFGIPAGETSGSRMRRGMPMHDASQAMQDIFFPLPRSKPGRQCEGDRDLIAPNQWQARLFG